uniref:Large ribosomal subunit protein mL53 n=1 Tax=Leptobrachium leishanense TaxID=445787 RepID=A0A8C5M5S8_9ANUR
NAACLPRLSVKSVAVRFCPFESSVQSTREFLESINAKKICSTNINFAVTVDVRHDKFETQVDILFVDGEHGSHLDILQRIGTRCKTPYPQRSTGASLERITVRFRP